jgi:hypothetical protein
MIRVAGAIGVRRSNTLRGFVAPGSPALKPVMGRNDVELRPMKFVRTHQSLIAWMLYGIVLFSGLVCSLSHGQMLRAFNQSGESVVCNDHHGMTGQMDMAQMGDHAQLMKLAMTDCAFAGTLALSLVFFIGLGWLARIRRILVPRSDYLLRKPPRHAFPGWSPQAP